ncbi:gamma-glutamyltransferase [Methylobacterium tarhaniae]|uniref:gamma-glutamyltransferase n=1 Tax=Methylobacterium tarhaniae TaxID=1187852 RepID=UPI003D012869
MPAHDSTPYRTQNWTVTKPVASGRDGIVVAQNREAAEAGAAILAAGGNAADAAFATAFALAAVEPWNSGLGGIGFALVLPAGATRATVVDFGPVSSRNTRAADYPLTGREKRDLFTWPEVEGDRNVHGPLSFCIPSAVAGYAALHEAFGTGRPVADLLAPALALARRGLAQDWYTTLKIASSASVLRLYEESARIYLPGGLPPVPPYQGTPGFLPLGRLAETLERLVDGGLRDFYEGGIARDLATDIAALGGIVDREDLARCRAVLRDAPTIAWRDDHLVHTAGGLTAAPTLADVVAGMADVALPRPGPDAAWFSALSTVMRDAYARRLAGLGAAGSGAAGSGTALEPGDTCTTHLTVVDRDGMLVSVTTTLLSSMGSRVVLPKTGVLMNNGVMWFDPRPGSANPIAAGARPLCNMCPVIVTPRTGEGPRLAAGASGGRRILASVYQTLAFLLDFGMEAGAAAHSPRIDVSGPEGTSADARLPQEVRDALAAAGPLTVVEHGVLPINFACPNFVRLESGEATGCSDVASPWSAAVAAG